jgi:predicted lipoprotein with Yx(FWY)xxD motif
MMSVAGTAFAIVALAGCSSTTGGSTYSNPSAAPSKSAPSSASLTTASSALGKIIVDGKGMTAYVFDKDTAGSGSSTCTGPCATAWPSITASSATPKVAGVTGKVGTITGVNGEKQITVNGLPLYTFARDKAAGDVTGQGVGNVWWVLSPSGDKISTPAPSPSSSSKPGY